jgi:hypothetical protein
MGTARLFAAARTSGPPPATSCPSASVQSRPLLPRRRQNRSSNEPAYPAQTEKANSLRADIQKIHSKTRRISHSSRSNGLENGVGARVEASNTYSSEKATEDRGCVLAAGSSAILSLIELVGARGVHSTSQSKENYLIHNRRKHSTAISAYGRKRIPKTEMET